jgi:hypothetical protein
MTITNLEENPAELYEQFLGFPHEEEKNYYDEFYKFCKEKIIFPRNDNVKEINILSIGTGYGRADLPFIKAFIEKNEPIANTFNVYCIDPSEFFARKLYYNLCSSFEGKFSIFSKKPKKKKPDRYETFFIEGVGISGKSFIKIVFFKKDLQQFLDTMGSSNIGFHCVMSFLSLQFVSKVKLLLPKLLAKLEKNGIIVIGEACKHAAWVATPPPLIFHESDKNYYCWYKLWSDWHKILRIKGIIRNIRLFPPHDFSLIFKFFDASNSFYKRKPIGNKDGIIEFYWEKALPPGIFKKIIKYIEEGKFKGIVSSIDLSEFSSGKEILALLKDDEFIKINNLYGTWRDWERTGDSLYFLNGLGIHFFSKEKDLSNEEYEKFFQKIILGNSFRTVEKINLNESSMDKERNSIKSPPIFPIISMSMKQYIEVDKGAFIIPICVRPNAEAIASISGSYIPASKVFIERKEEYKEFFKGFDLLEGETEEKKKELIPRYWLLLHELSLKLTERQSSTAPEIQQVLNLDPSFDVIVDMDADSEEIITISRSSISFKLQGARFKALRQRVWNIINDNEKFKEKFKELNDRPKKEEREPKKVIKQLKSFWGESTIEKLFDENYGLKDSFAPVSFFKPAVAEDIIDNLFGKESFNQIRIACQSLFDRWKQQSGIILKLDEIKKSQGFEYDSERIWTILCQLYKYGIYIYEKDLMYVFHISLPMNKRTNVWGAIHLFMHKKEASYFITESLELTDLFYKFILPFDNLLYREVHSLQIESVGEEKGEKAGTKKIATISGHEAGAQLISIGNLISCISDEFLGKRLKRTAERLIEGSINYLHLYLAHDPGISDVKDFYIDKNKPLKLWLEKIKKLSWQIALSREIKNVNIREVLLDDLSELLEERNMPEIVLDISDDLFFKPSVDIETKYPNFSLTFSRWFLAGLSNSIKWSGQIKGVNNLNCWVKKKSTAFKSIRVEISQDKEKPSVKITILNKYHYKNPGRAEKSEGTRRVLEVINEDLPLKKGSFKFGPNENNSKEWETSIVLVGDIFKFATNKEE